LHRPYPDEFAALECREPDAENGAAPEIASRILVIRQQRVLLDSDLAKLYGVSTKRLNEQTKRNRDRFPSDFMFQLSADEKAEVVATCDHLRKLRFSSSLPYVFTEHGAIQAANVLATTQAVELGIYVVRTFVRLRERSTLQDNLARRLSDLELKLGSVSSEHARFSEETRLQLRQLLEAIRSLASPPELPQKPPIGFVPPTTRKPDQGRGG
jgi:hypothetical protein